MYFILILFSNIKSSRKQLQKKTLNFFRAFRLSFIRTTQFQSKNKASLFVLNHILTQHWTDLETFDEHVHFRNATQPELIKTIMLSQQRHSEHRSPSIGGGGESNVVQQPPFAEMFYSVRGLFMRRYDLRSRTPYMAPSSADLPRRRRQRPLRAGTPIWILFIALSNPGLCADRLIVYYE